MEEHLTANSAAFGAWAQVYDGQANPLLALEERFLKHMLPDISGKHVLDMGCGTGRWLAYLDSLKKAASLCGVDGSQEMLQIAEMKLSPTILLIHSSLPHLPLPSENVDLVLASFVLSYIRNINCCANEMMRVLRDGGDLFLSDMHPQTAAELKWRRNFHSTTREYALETTSHSLEELVEMMNRKGARLLAHYELCFGEPEYELFAAKGKEDAWQTAYDKPAIYLLHFRKQPRPSKQSFLKQDHFFLTNAAVTLGPYETVRADIAIDQGRIAQTIFNDQSPKSLPIDLRGYQIFPGLINSHDHLEFALYPRLGEPPYRNATEWATDIHARYRDLILQHKLIPKDVRFMWGALRNLLCGVTTVCNHNPFDPTFDRSDFPIKVVKGFNWEHSLTFGKNIEEAHKQTRQGEPFIIHACEGMDAASSEEFQKLRDINAIGDQTILIHGLAMTASDINYLNQQRASLVACPSSNYFLFGRTLTWDQCRLIDRLALGSDSPITAAGDLLDEVRFAREELNLPINMIYECVTNKSARVLRLLQGEGRISPNGSADFFAVRTAHTNSAAQLASLSWRDVELVIVDGTVRLASENILERLPDSFRRGLFGLAINGVPRWVSMPVRNMFETAANILGADKVSLCGRTISLMEA